MVESLSDLRLLGHLPISLCHFLLLHEARHYKSCLWRALLWVHDNHFILLFRPHRDNWVLCLLLVCAGDIRISEDRLNCGCQFGSSSIWKMERRRMFKTGECCRALLKALNSSSVLFLNWWSLKRTSCEP